MLTDLRTAEKIWKNLPDLLTLCEMGAFSRNLSSRLLMHEKIWRELPDVLMHATTKGLTLAYMCSYELISNCIYVYVFISNILVCYITTKAWTPAAPTKTFWKKPV